MSAYDMHYRPITDPWGTALLTLTRMPRFDPSLSCLSAFNYQWLLQKEAILLRTLPLIQYWGLEFAQSEPFSNNGPFFSPSPLCGFFIIISSLMYSVLWSHKQDSHRRMYRTTNEQGAKQILRKGQGSEMRDAWFLFNSQRPWKLVTK